MIDRRQVLQAGAGVVSLALAEGLARTSGRVLAADNSHSYEPVVGDALPKLPYAVDALEPHIDARTMTIHHDKHHAAYVDNLKKALASHPEFQKKSLVALLKDVKEVPEDIRQAVINNGGGHVNHSLFWKMMAPKAGGIPKGDVGQAISKVFGTFEKFQSAMNEAALKRFGSGWAWLVVGPNRTLKIVSTANQDSPFTAGDFPILGVDVWEHAYYLKYQNRRADYLAAWWNVVNWDYVNELYRHAQVA